ncbi:bifunctional [glutamate--ammonia ligase]-adenylyl-L-tyrosine phosphorylase/[glutamate--ammonia-ligase] adenylyltransferase [Shewanella schlegeliana]|uniref:Bifunctional glutamine synthetase adenylyltransferase/adenylyl-removing enzyme n=1 Tax=Shewanella schlegeliana TaxID=190308 RepID=A0ABS1SWJ6_9GAMM|nr:bifunctional [glutamate--ammonia ligase]-adenylyl-L-tyrosine phosphorylase/[glutamate--ammonia-ligase] adenylyltransferase [Shewanella schlegeliana]MBL4912715.1 bifunctional [glutamate--ammonia ligase]-adenylyl-L-tyrosine phosphorylase/[glutamate--ammonia-ligase] adenylyltransferase [Shewanella schlegeliana]MCL1109775.1 bifunctional [glutamate--ammonia ligase]-adenylyl-L-tyrosine phosphorylase/[glutamate--ammonia-ligase] adenylyltransferase [Shewanella schlegeliana]GIU30348.1 glutamate-ammoni
MHTASLGNKLVSTQMAATAELYWQRLNDSSAQLVSSLTQAQQQELKTVFALSDFIGTQLCRNPDWIPALFEHELHNIERQGFDGELSELLTPVTDEEQVKRILRQYRNRQMVRIAWRDFFDYSEIKESLLDLSALAEALVIAARDWLYKEMCTSQGTPSDRQGKPQKLLILGMGKLGGRELNFSSDIDLIFTFPEHGETIGGRRAIENQQFFIRMGQRLVNLLNQVTVDGFVYRVDMRLRPYGESGPLVVSFSGLEDYYQEQGRDWERYAMVKARALGPWTSDSDELHDLLRPFVYRRYLDFSAIESLRKMKGLITQEVRRRKLTDNIKLGAGGIREVEFVVQSFQLIRGGREPALRQQSLFGAINTLYQMGQLEYLAVDELEKSYILLRRVENLLQAINDEQTQTLPSDELNWQRLCYALNADTEMDLREQIETAMRQIHRHFNDAVGGNNLDDHNETWTQQLWNAYEDDHALAILEEQGIDDEKLWPLLNSWHETVVRRTIGPRGRETLDKLMPKLLCEFTSVATPSKAFEQVSKVLDQILTRTTYLELLCENPGARQQLVSLCLASPWIAEQLAKFPMLLDELIDPAQLYDTTSLDDYGSELRQYLLRVPEDDMEQQMEALRQFKLSQQLKIAAADVTGVLPVMEVSDHLTFLAEAIIEQVVHQAWAQVSARHGVPENLKDNEMGFAVVGYGKAGGIELGYGSDLDLVFLHNGSQAGQTNGDRAIDIGHFYLKLAQRVLHLFSTRTNSGELYEVDMRLRPSGASGLLVSEIEHFGEYQRNDAWTWEHQALVRARFMFGDASLSSRFNELRAEVLETRRDNETLAKDVREMRLKMRDHLLRVDEGMFDLKQSCGGIADIEFLAQYLVLAHACDHKSLSFWSDNVRIFAELAELELLPFETAQLLTQVYCHLRDESHRLVLQQKKPVLPIDDVKPYSEQIEVIYQEILGG